MHVTSRSYLTAGIAALGVGALALAPVQPIPNQMALAPERVVSNLGVALASTIDPITPWVDTFETAGANIATLFEFYTQKPFPLLQTIGANIATYFEELGNGNAGLIPAQIWNNIQTFFQAPWDPGAQIGLSAPPDFPDETLIAYGEYASDTQPADGSNSPQSLALAPFQIWLGEIEKGCGQDGSCTYPQAAPILNFLNTPYSGQVLGLLGPLLAPLAVLTRSFTAIGEFFQAGDVIGAINELINIPANLVNGVLNGAGFIDLTAIISSLLPLPIEKIGLNLGGLLTATPLDGSLADPNNPPTQYSGGVGIDAIAADVLLEFGGIPVGWIGSSIGLGQFLADRMVVTPPPPAGTAAATVSAPAEAAAPVEVAPAVADEAPTEVAPAVAEVEDTAAVVTEVVGDTARADLAAVEEPAPADLGAVEAEIADGAELEAPAEAAEPAPEPAASAGSDDSDDSGARATDSRRGANDAD